tara:strand:+ start:7422 stop:7622 length:201 start_codon:yes stop_codon:yes gene_type:complete
MSKIDKPEHYRQGRMETWDAITGLGLGYLEGNVVKYVSRYKYKGDPVGDLKKARAYIDKLIEQVQE